MKSDGEILRTIDRDSVQRPKRATAKNRVDRIRRRQNRKLEIGSDIEIAIGVGDDLHAEFGEVLHAEGEFWRYIGTHWEAIPQHELRVVVHQYDGARFGPSGSARSRVKLSKTRVDSILNEFAARIADPGFFEFNQPGINCASGFIRFDADGTPSIKPHDRQHRCRHVLPGHWKPDVYTDPPSNSLLHQLLSGVFHDDDDATDKVSLVGEVCGAAALGWGTKLLQPRAVILKGEKAENGKSQVLELIRGLLPPNAVASVTAASMGDERHIIGLVGKLLNASDELSSANAIASEAFKAIVTGEPVSGRDVYRSRVEFRPIAQHVFATNTLPTFQGGIDRGVRRRLLVIPFNRVIPMEERVEALGKRVAAKEPDQLLEFAVDGARRLISQRVFTSPTSSNMALLDWIYSSDPVLAFLDECVRVLDHTDDRHFVTTRSVYEQFRTWAKAEGFMESKLPAIASFVQRVQANLSHDVYKRTSKGRYFLGIEVSGASSSDEFK